MLRVEFFTLRVKSKLRKLRYWPTLLFVPVPYIWLKLGKGETRPNTKLETIVPLVETF